MLLTNRPKFYRFFEIKTDRVRIPELPGCQNDAVALCLMSLIPVWLFYLLCFIQQSREKRDLQNDQKKNRTINR